MRTSLPTGWMLLQPNGIQFAPLGSQILTLPLELGKRYQITVTNYSVIPRSHRQSIFRVAG